MAREGRRGRNEGHNRDQVAMGRMKEYAMRVREEERALGKMNEREEAAFRERYLRGLTKDNRAHHPQSPNNEQGESTGCSTK